MNRLSSLDILLDDSPPEDYGRNQILVALTSGEAAVARFGLMNRLSYYYNRRNNKNRYALTEEDRLKAVYDFLADKIDRYRREAQNIARVLEIRDGSVDPIYQAIAMSSVMLAQQARRKGWPPKSQLEDLKLTKFYEARSLDPEDFANTRLQAVGIAIENDRYWVQRLQQSRTHYVVPLLKHAIAESTPIEIEV